jgi:hypothetical protein
LIGLSIVRPAGALRNTGNTMIGLAAMLVVGDGVIYKCEDPGYRPEPA